MAGKVELRDKLLYRAHGGFKFDTVGVDNLMNRVTGAVKSGNHWKISTKGMAGFFDSVTAFVLAQWFHAGEGTHSSCECCSRAFKRMPAMHLRPLQRHVCLVLAGFITASEGLA